MRLSALRTGRVFRLDALVEGGKLMRRAASALSRATAWPARHVHWKIILPYAVLVLLLGGAATYLATGLVTGSLRERFDNQLVEASRVFSDAVVRQERRNIETVRAVAFTEGVNEAIAAGDAARLGSLIEGLAANNEIEYLEVLDQDGTRLKAIHLDTAGQIQYEEIVNSDAPARWAPVSAVLESGDGAKATAIVETEMGNVFYTAGSIRSDGSVVGVVLVGVSLETLVRQIKSEALADATFYGPDGSPRATTFVDSGPDASAQADLSAPAPDLADAFNRGGVFREPKKIWGREYELMYAPLTLQGQETGSYSVALPSNFLMQAESDARWRMVALFSLGMTAALAAGLYLSRAITDPVGRLMRTAERVTAGDFTARTGVHSRDEIGKLGAAIDQMTETLQGHYLGTLRVLGSAVANKDAVTLGHAVRVGRLAAMIGRRLSLDDRTLAQLEIGGYLHDVGRIGIRDSVRLKLEALTPKQRQLLETHPHLELRAEPSSEVGAPMRSFTDAGRDPNGLSMNDEDGPVVARLVEVADIYDALTQGPSSTETFTPGQALALLRSQVGALLSIGMLEALAAVVPEWERRRAGEPELLGHRAPASAESSQHYETP